MKKRAEIMLDLAMIVLLVLLLGAMLHNMN